MFLLPSKFYTTGRNSSKIQYLGIQVWDLDAESNYCALKKHIALKCFHRDSHRFEYSDGRSDNWKCITFSVTCRNNTTITKTEEMLKTFIQNNITICIIVIFMFSSYTADWTMWWTEISGFEIIAVFQWHTIKLFHFWPLEIAVGGLNNVKIWWIPGGHIKHNNEIMTNDNICHDSKLYPCKLLSRVIADMFMFSYIYALCSGVLW